MPRPLPTPPAAPIDDAALQLLRGPMMGIGLVMLVGAPLLVVPQWVAAWLGWAGGPLLPASASVLILGSGMLLGSLLWTQARDRTLTARLATLPWLVATTTPGLLGMYYGWGNPEHLAAMIHDFPLLVWVGSATSSGILLRPRFSVLLGLYCTLQYALMATYAQPHLAQLSGPSLVLGALTEPLPMIRRGLVILGGAAGAAALAWSTRRALAELLVARQNHKRSESERKVSAVLHQQSEQMSQAKTRFLAELSHELRTPLNGIRGTAELLVEDHTLDPTTRRRARGLVGSARHLQAVLSDALDTALVEEGKLEVALGPVDLLELVTEVAQVHAAFAMSRGTQLTVRDRPTRPAVVRADPRRLRQVLVNLITNALNHGEAQVVALSIREGAETAAWVLVVEDDGIGMDAALQARIFEPYVRLTDGTATGAGLGLAICRALIHAMDGQLTVQSAPGAGARFFVTLPPEGEPQHARPHAPPAELLLPEAPAVAALRAHAEAGDMAQVQALLDTLAAQSSLTPFVRAVRDAADRFDDRAILDLLPAPSSRD